MVEPILAPNSTWFSQGGTTIKRASITEIEIKDTYTPSGTDYTSWDGSAAKDGSVTIYVEGTKLTIAGNGSGCVYANPDSSYAFADANGSDKFTKLTKITGGNLLNTSNVTTMQKMFQQSSLTSVDVSNWDTSNVTSMQGVFDRASSLVSVDVSNWNTSQVTTMRTMFQGCITLQSLDLSKWDVSNVTDMSHMFYSNSSLGDMNLTSIGDVGNWDTSNVTTMKNMFMSCANLKELNVSNWDMSNVTSLHNMFANCESLISLDVSGWDTGKCQTFEYMFGADESHNMKLKYVDVSNWDTSSCTNMIGMFQTADIESLDLSKWDVSKVTSMSHMFADCCNMISYNFSGWNTENLTSMNAMFNNNDILTHIDVSHFNTSKVTEFAQLFEYCYKLKTIIGIDKWNTSSATTFYEMFSHNHELRSLDLNNFNTSNVTSITRMFADCSSLVEIKGLNNWNTQNILYMTNTFQNCSSLVELDLSSWSLPNLETFTYVFDGCSSLETIYVSDNWDLSYLDVYWPEYEQDLENNFTGCASLVGGSGTVYSSDHVDYDYARIDGGTSKPGYLTNIDDPTQLLIKTGTLHKMGLSVRNISGGTTKYTPSEMVDALKTVDSDISEQSELIYRITNVLEGKAGGGGGGDASKAYDAGFKDAIERYAPEFTESGAVVTCYPVGGFPLNVVSQITPIQAGSGDASPTNVRPLSAHTAVKVTIANETDSAEYNAEFGQEAYCGTFDWSTGLLTLTHKMLTLTGNESGWSKYGTGSVLNFGLMRDSKKGTSDVYGYCSHVKTVAGGNITWSGVRKTNVNGGFETYAVSFWGLPDNEVSTWTNYLKEQANSGTPVQILYQLEVPITVQLTPREIFALSGANTIQSTTGDTTVTGKGDWTAMVANLATEADYQEALREMGVNV